MIPAIIQRFDAARESLRQQFKQKHPEDYDDIVKAVVSAVTTDDYGECSLDPDRIHRIDDGDYQGTLLFVIAAKGYQPSDYWYVKVGYGSCSGCDTLQGISGYSSEPPTDEQANDYLTLALHIAQGIKTMNKDD